LNGEVVIREMLRTEEEDVRRFFERNLGPIDNFFFNLSFREALKSSSRQLGASLVAEYQGKIVGCFSLRIVVYGEKRIGLIDAIVTDRNFRGSGIGKSLLDQALSWFEKKRCEIICATADRFNSPSWNMFIHKGFSLYTIRGQFRDLGLNFIRLWFAEFYVVGAGTFFLRKINGKPDQPEPSEGWSFLVAWIGFAFILWLMVFRQGASLSIPLVLGVGGLSLFAHEFAHKLTASRLGLKTVFRAWDSGILFSSLLAAIFSALYPSYGQTYVKQVDWRYDPKQRIMGLIYAAGPITSLILATFFWISLPYFNNELLRIAGRIGYVSNYVLVIFNLIPIQASGGFAWDGRRIYTWNKAVWASLAIAITVLVLVDMLL